MIKDTEVIGDITKEYYFDEQGNMIVNTKQDVSEILKNNKEIQDSGAWKGKDMHHVASIPMTVVLEWKKLGVDVYKKSDWPKVKRLLNDPDWRHVRTGGGIV